MLSNTATPIYYGQFRERVLKGEIPVCQEISMEMNRIDSWIRDPRIYYDDKAVEGFIAFCETELTLTDGSDLHMLDSFKLWAEEIFGWYYFVEHSVPVPNKDGGGFHYIKKKEKYRMINKQYLIVGRGAAKTMYASCLQSFFLTCDPATTEQITTAPTMSQADEVLSPIRTALIRRRGPVFKFMAEGTNKSTSKNKVDQAQLCSTKKGIENRLTGSELVIRPMTIDKLQSYRCKVATIDEWLSGDIKEDVGSAVEQSASKIKDYLIVFTSSEGTVRNGPGDTIKLELMDILKGKYVNNHVSIFYYRLDDVKEVAYPSMWAKANPNLGYTVSYETYQQDKERAENAPSTRNDILAKRFGIPMEGLTYFFTYPETLVHPKRDFWGTPCAMGADLSMGDDFCAFTFLFPLRNNTYGIKARSYISSLTYDRLPIAQRQKYDEFMNEGSLIVLDGTVLDLDTVYDDLDKYIIDSEYDVRAFGYDPYNAKGFVERWTAENGPFGVEKVIQGARTESVPLGELKILASERALLFDEQIMQFCMGNSIVNVDTNGNQKLNKERRDKKIDNVAAMMDAWVAYKAHKDQF